jgi:hypothetical protein
VFSIQQALLSDKRPQLPLYEGSLGQDLVAVT